MRLTRTGEVFSTEVAPDDQGKPGAWTEVAPSRTAALPKRVQVAFIANSGLLWAKKEQLVEAVFDQVTVSQKANFAPLKFGVVKGAWQRVETATDGTVTIQSNGENWRTRSGDGSRNIATMGWGSVAEVEGDFSVQARVIRLEAKGEAPGAWLGLVARESVAMRARQVGLELGGLVSRKEQNSVAQVWRLDAAKSGTPARLVLKAGTYRDPIIWPERDQVGRTLPLVIEGEKVEGKTGAVIFSGAAATGYEPKSWTKRADGAWTHPWTLNWGGKDAKARQETISVLRPDGTAQRLKLVFPDFSNAAGTFTVDEAAKQLVMALPEGLDEAAFQRCEIQVAVRNTPLLVYGAINNEMDLGEQVVLRNLVFESVGGDSAVALQDWLQPVDATREVLLEDLTFRRNAGRSFYLSHLRNFTLRRVVSEDNGDGSWLVASEGRIEDCAWRRN